jgi:dihydrolipoamide dehydrogenase
MLIYPADVIAQIQESHIIGIDAEIKNVDFKAIMERMRKWVSDSQAWVRQGIREQKGLEYYEGEGHFAAPYTLEVNGETIKADKIIIASGARPFTPPIKGLDKVEYLTNETLLELEEKPESLIIIGGGYIAVEYGHFFSAMGTKVTMLEMADRLVTSEEPEISDLLKKELGRRMDVFTGVQAEEIKKADGGISVIGRDKRGGVKEYKAQQLLMAVGRRSNADLLKVENTGVELDGRGFIKVNEYLETTKKNIYAVGDANGQQMFTHVANRESEVAGNNVLHDSKKKMDYTAAPNAVYSHPQIASVGLTEEAARKTHKKILVGKAMYSDVAMGDFMKDETSFAKAIADAATGKLLGFHIIGPYAPILIQEVIDAIAAGGNPDFIGQGLHIHPAAPELILRTLSNLREA